MNDGDRWALWLIWARTLAAVGIVGGLLALVAEAYLSRGFDDASRLFQLLQGVILSTLAYLFAAQAADRAEQAVIAERKQRAIVETVNAETDADIEELRRALADALSTLDRLASDPDIRRKIDVAGRGTGGDEHAPEDPSGA